MSVGINRYRGTGNWRKLYPYTAISQLCNRLTVTAYQLSGHCLSVIHAVAYRILSGAEIGIVTIRSSGSAIYRNRAQLHVTVIRIPKTVRRSARIRLSDTGVNYRGDTAADALCPRLTAWRRNGIPNRYHIHTDNRRTDIYPQPRVTS